ncbi:MAG: hypothetical protein M1821_005578 [Bathelium mastoideum]|nr:MAG: hypothetical protein M1821_005578 [Bathelium mastoideum]
MSGSKGSTIWVRKFTRDDSLDKDTPIDLTNRFEGDPFADWLRQGNRTAYRVIDEVLTDISKETTNYSLQIFVVGDGSYVSQANPRKWFNPHVRLLAVVKPTATPRSLFFVVGPLEVTDPDRFLQVASWDGGSLRFFAVEDIQPDGQKSEFRGWIYQGSSYDAFTDGQADDSSYLGPFNGHVNGTVIMKELHKPWYHWLSSKNPNFQDCITSEGLEKVQKVPYLVGSDGSPLSGKYVATADNLEPTIVNIVIGWYRTRLVFDFSDPADTTKQSPRTRPGNLHRWAAHLLLTTTINIVASPDSDARTYTVPSDHFCNLELLSRLHFSNNKKLLPSAMPKFTADMNLYNLAVKELRLSILQEVKGEGDPPKYNPPDDIAHHEILDKGTLGGGKQTGAYDEVIFVETLPYSEGVPFVCLQASFEDAQGVIAIHNSLSSIGKKYPKSLLSDKAMQAILMMDFQNPVYSWRRASLMAYLPQSATLTGSMYDFEAQFVDAVRRSKYNKDPNSPESQFLALYDKPPDHFQSIFSTYFSKIQKRLKTQEGVSDYLKLAESRRRIFRPLPLDEFGAQLPYALGLKPDWKKVEMTQDGTITDIPQRGLEFFERWTKTLHGFDPHILPSQSSSEELSVPPPSASKCPVLMKWRGTVTDSEN